MNKKATLALPLVLLVLLMVALLVSLGLFITKKMSKAELLADDFISMSAAEISDPEAGRSNIKSNILGESSIK